MEKQLKAVPPIGAAEWWDRTSVQADTCYELGRSHASAGRTAAARESFERALSCAHSLRAFRGQITGPPPEYEDQLEGKITTALLLLDVTE